MTTNGHNELSAFPYTDKDKDDFDTCGGNVLQNGSD